MNLQIGDVVKLKSGGPKMTVEAIMGAGRLRCAWFSGDKQNLEVFNALVLEKADEAAK